MEIDNGEWKLENWIEYRLADLCSKIVSGGTPLTSNKDFYEPPEIPWLKTGEVKYCNIYETENYISQEGLKNSSAKLVPINSVIIAMYGQGDTAGRVAVNKIPLSTNQACCNLIINDTKANYCFVYYYLWTQYKQMIVLKTGGAQPNLNVEKIKNLKILLPHLNIQQKIANILSRYDETIENNNKRIKLLEQMAQNLYKEWFVRFRFPGWQNVEFENGIPKGWEVEKLFDVVNVTYGYAFASELFCDDESLNPVVRIRDILDNHTNTFTSETCSDKYIIKENEILVGMDGIFHMCMWNGEKAYQNQRVVKLTSKTDEISNYFLFLSVQPQVKFWEQTIAGTTVAHLGDKHLKRMTVLLPSENILKEATKIFDSLMKQNNQLFKANINLAKQRDLLLPRLMSGKVEVK